MGVGMQMPGIGMIVPRAMGMAMRGIVGMGVNVVVMVVMTVVMVMVVMSGHGLSPAPVRPGCSPACR